MRWMVGLAATIVVVVALGVAALTVATRRSGTAVVDLRVGDCFDLPVGGDAATAGAAGDDTVDTIDRVDLVDCSRPHQAEVVSVGELNEGGGRDYPADAELFAELDRRCAAVAPLVGARFGILPIAPTSATWNQLGGRYQCVALPIGGGTTVGALLAD